jgi:peptide/nickel transport system permease protein
MSLGATEQHQQLRSRSLFQKALYRIRHDTLTLTALTVMSLLALVSVLAPFIAENILNVQVNRVENYNTFAPIGSTFEGTLHILGTDELGRDHLARLLYGGRVSLGIGFAAAAVTFTIGVSLGLITGFFGGWLDDLVIWFITTLNSIPQLFLLLIISALLNPTPLSLILVLAFLSWTGTTRLVRGETFSLREREFIVAARAIGASSPRIMFLHILPNVFSVTIINLFGLIGGLILTESALSFLSFGIPSSTAPSWGNMLSQGLDIIKSPTARHLVILPGLMISITVLCLYIIGDGLRDAFDPRISD